MFKKTAIGKAFIVGMVLMTAISAFGGSAMAASTYYVGTSGTNDAVTYDSIQEAVDNAENGSVIKVASGTYNESVQVDTKNITIEVYNTSNGNVTVDATGTNYGDAFYGQEAHNLTFGSNVEIQEDVAYVNTSGTNASKTYDNIQNATDAISNGTTVMIAPGEYKESINVTTKNVSYANYDPSSGDVTINATNTTSGSAFTGEFADSVRVDAHVVVEQEVTGGGGSIGDVAGQEFMGIPVWAIGVFVVVVGFIYYESEDN